MQHATSKGHDAIADLLQRASRVMRATPPGLTPAPRLLAAPREATRTMPRSPSGRVPISKPGTTGGVRRCCWPPTHDHLDIARLLVALGADPDALDASHDTPWLVTGVTGSVSMLEVLLPANPDLTIRNRYAGYR